MRRKKVVDSSIEAPYNYHMKTIKTGGQKAQIQNLAKDGSLFSFEVFSFSMEDDSSSVVASGKIVCDGAVDVRVEFGKLSQSIEDAIVSAVSDV